MTVEPRDAQVGRGGNQDDAGLPFSPAVGCLISVLIGLVATGVVYLGLFLASGREIRARVGEFNEARLWLVREDRHAGIGISTSNLVDPEMEPADACVVTRVRYLLWRTDGSAQNVRYCECYQRAGDTWLAIGACGS